MELTLEYDPKKIPKGLFSFMTPYEMYLSMKHMYGSRIMCITDGAYNEHRIQEHFERQYGFVKAHSRCMFTDRGPGYIKCSKESLMAEFEFFSDKHPRMCIVTTSSRDYGMLCFGMNKY